MTTMDKRKTFMLDEKMSEDMSTYVKMLGVSEGEYIRQAIRRHLIHTALMTRLHRWSKELRENPDTAKRNWELLALMADFQEFIPSYTAELLTLKQFETYVTKEFGSVDLLVSYVTSA